MSNEKQNQSTLPHSTKEISVSARKQIENATKISFPPWVCSRDTPGQIDLLRWDIEFHVLYGGRAAGRSYSVGLALLLTGMQKPRQILCAREYQSSISKSVHSQLAAIIRDKNFGHFYKIEKNAIKGANGTIFSFTGLKVQPDRIKSYADYDDCWVEEADSVSRESWAILTPTIRKPGRRFFICFNPSFETTTTYQLFVANPPPRTRIYHATYLDNPFITEELIEEAKRARLTDFEEYSNIWLGKPRASLHGAVYAKELTLIQKDNLIRTFSVDYTQPTYVAADLGHSDATCLWFIQRSHHNTFAVVDYIEYSGEYWNYYLNLISQTPYRIANIILPHDAASHTASARSTIEEQTLAFGLPCTITKKLLIEDGIQLTRNFLRRATFLRSKQVLQGLERLRNYSYSTKNKPIHNQYSHAADALRYAATFFYTEQQQPQTITITQNEYLLPMPA